MHERATHLPVPGMTRASSHSRSAAWCRPYPHLCSHLCCVGVSALRCYSMEVELAGADFVGNELQRCGLLLGASGESAPPCPALRWPTRDIFAVICDLRAVRMQAE